MPQIKNEMYMKFVKEGLINLIKRQDFEKMLEVADWKYGRESARAFLILLYYTGRRPSEILDLNREDFRKERNYLVIMFKTRKHGRATTLYLPLSNPHIKELYEYIQKIPPFFNIFWFVRSHKKVRIKDKVYQVNSNRVYYHIKKWCRLAGIPEVPPYYFRHNRLSELAMKGATVEDLKYWKGAKTILSVEPYLHLSSSQAKKLAKLLK